MVESMRPRLRPNPQCPICDGRGMILDDSIYATPCSCGREPLDVIVGVPSMFPSSFLVNGQRIEMRDLSFDLLREKANDTQLALIDEAEALVNSPMERGWIAVSETSGTGKTTLCATILAEVRRSERGLTHSIRARNVTEWFEAMRASFSGDNSLVSEEMDECSSCSLLLLDDMGVGNWTPWVLDRLYQVLNRRSAYGRPTFVTANLSPAGLAAAIQPRQASRLADVATWKRFGDTDRRIARAKALAGGAR